MKAIEVTDNTFDTEVLQAEGKVLVDMWAPWCSPCRMMAPVIDDIAAEYDGSLKVCKLNVDENPEISSRYGVMSTPTLMLFENGQVAGKMVGFKPKEEIVRELGV
ncbi:MAG: thioredoxin [Thermoanaerobacterales bacterium]|nr:thioredoxin [Thermoanaerobacterales bacterium]